MNTTKQWDSELGREFTIPELEILEDETSEEFIERHRANIAMAIYMAAKLLIENEYERAPIFAVQGEDVVFYLDKEETDKSVAQCLEYFTEIEDYEKCSELVQLKKKNDERK